MADAELFDKGNALYDKGKIKESLSMYNQAIAINPNNVKALFNKGICLRDLGLNRQALDCYDLLLSKNPSYAKAYKQKGCCLLDLGDKTQALEAFNKAISFDPNNEFFYYYKATCLSEMNRYEEAIESYDRAITLNKKFIEAYNCKANCLYKIEKMEDALNCYTLALQFDETNPYIIYNKGNCFFHLGKRKEAMKCYSRAIEIKKDFARAINAKGRCYEEDEDYENAYKCYEEAIGIFPNDEIIMTNVGNCLRKQKKINEAMKIYDRVIKLYPKFSEAYFGKGMCLLREKKFEESVSLFDQAISIFPKDEDYYLAKGQALLNMKEYDKGIEAIDIVLQMNDEIQEGLLLKAKCYEGKGDNESANKLYEKGNELSSDSIGAQPRKGKRKKSILRKQSDSQQESSDTYHRKETANTFIISSSNFEKKEPLGCGSYGPVYKGLFKENPIVIKKIFFSSNEEAKKIFCLMQNEMKILVKLHHRHIVPYFGLSKKDHKNSLCIISHQCLGGNLNGIISLSLSYPHIIEILYQIGEGLKYLNNPDPVIILGNLKPSNILFENKISSDTKIEDICVKLGDFGFENLMLKDKINSKSSMNININVYSSPEVLNGQKATEKSDVYSFGLIMYTMITKKIPYYEQNFSSFAQLINFVVNMKGQVNLEEIEINQHVELKKIIMNCLKYDDKERPSIAEIVDDLTTIKKNNK